MIFLFCFLSFAAFAGEISQLKEKAVSRARPPLEQKKAPKLTSQVNGKQLLPLEQRTDHSQIQELLIEKLEYTLSALPENHRARKALRLRLARILSLKAEEGFIKAEREKCKTCRKTAEASAKRSLALYQSLDSDMKDSHPLLHAKSLFRQAYLYRFLGDRDKALSELKRIAGKFKIDWPLKAGAWFSIGELYFERYNYEKSLQAFNKVLERPPSSRSFQAFYRKIWSLYNLSLYESSIRHLESFLNSDLYSQSENQQLKQKLEKELITLYSQGEITEKRLSFLYRFLMQDLKRNSPAAKQQRLFDLAQALSRIGRAKESNRAWRFYISKSPSPEKSARAYSFMIANDLTLNSPKAPEDIGEKAKKVFKLFQKAEISPALRSLFKKQMKAAFGKIKNLKLSEKQKRELLFLYQQYISLYPEDVDILSKTAYLAGDLKEYSLAGHLFQKAVLNIERQNKDQKKLKENLSLLQMKMAELGRERNKRIQAYDFYIQHGSSKETLFKAGYQKAYIHYESGEYKKAFKEFQKPALSEFQGKSREISDLQLKAAHLSLSSLAALTDPEEELIPFTERLIKKFPEEKSEFIRIRHAALLNQVKKLVSDKDFSHRPTQASSDKNILKAWETLKLFSVKEAAKKEAFTYHFNRLLIAKELLDFKAMKRSFHFLLTYKNLNKKDREIILKWKLWLAELQFDFKEVLRIVKALQKEESSEEHILRLARLTELSGESPVKRYQSFIEKFPQSPSVEAVFTSLLEKSPPKDQKIFLKKYSSLFQKKPELLAQMALKADKGHLDEGFLKFFTSLSFMKNSSIASFLKKKEAIESFEKELSLAADFRLPKSLTGQRLTRAIKDYSGKLDALGAASEKALRLRDWTVSVFALFHWEKELSRFYSSIRELPLPKGLNEEEKQSYARLLKDQLQPYKDQASRLKKEWEKLWSGDFLNDYKKSLQQNKALHALLKWEMEKLSLIADREKKNRLEALISSLKRAENQEESKTQIGSGKPQSLKRAENQKEIKEMEDPQIQSLYQSLKKNPFDKGSLVQLLNIERKRKNEAMSHYLAERIKSLNKKTRGLKL